MPAREYDLDIATAWRDAMLVQSFRESRGMARTQLEEAVEAARSDGERLARLRVEQELAEIRANAVDELAHAHGLRLKATRLRRALDAELKKARASGDAEAQRLVDEARQRAAEILQEAERAAAAIRNTARQAAESEVRALLAELEATRSSTAASSEERRTEAA